MCIYMQLISIKTGIFQGVCEISEGTLLQSTPYTIFFLLYLLEFWQIPLILKYWCACKQSLKFLNTIQESIVCEFNMKHMKHIPFHLCNVVLFRVKHGIQWDINVHQDSCLMMSVVFLCRRCRQILVRGCWLSHRSPCSAGNSTCTSTFRPENGNPIHPEPRAALGQKRESCSTARRWKQRPCHLFMTAIQGQR